MTVVREEFGPTLPELLGPRLHLRVRTVWLGLAAVGLLAVAMAAWLSVRPDPGRTQVIVRTPVTFNLLYTDAVRRVAPRTGELLRLQSRSGPPQSAAIRPLRLPAYRGDVNGYLTLLSARLIEEMSSSYAGFAYRGDGRVSINTQPGYQIVFQARIGGRTTYGKRVLLVATATPSPHEGLDMTFLASRSAAIPNADAVAANGGLKIPYRSVRFGTDRP